MSTTAAPSDETWVSLVSDTAMRAAGLDPAELDRVDAATSDARALVAETGWAAPEGPWLAIHRALEAHLPGGWAAWLEADSVQATL